jgi:hypothetical protein
MRLTFIKGIVAPPRHIVVNKTTINVLATITNFVFVENSKCKHKAKVSFIKNVIKVKTFFYIFVDLIKT